MNAEKPKVNKAESIQIKKKWEGLRDLVYNTAVEHGWHEEHRPLEEVLDLCHCELSEAVEELRKGDGHEYYHDESGKPEGYYVELTDCIIRCLDFLGEVGGKATPIPPNWKAEKEKRLRSICTAHSHLSNAFLWNFDVETVVQWVRSAIGVLVVTLEAEGQDVEALIREKDAYNKTRPKKHGKQF